MADLYNSQRILGVRLQAEGTTQHNFQQTIGIVPVADATTFTGNDRTLGIAMLGADQAIYNDQPVIGGVLISDGRTRYNDHAVVPVAVRSGAMFDFLAGTVTGGSKTFSRSSAAWRFDATGALVSAATDVLRLDYDGTTLLPRGVLLEVARTNSLRNSTGAGAAAGTPGTAPTNWGVTGTTAGITRNVAAAGTEDGISYVDFQFVGTASGTAGFFIAFESTTQIVAAAGQTWTASAYTRLMSGSVSGVYTAIVCSGRTAAGASASDQSEVSFTPTTAALKTQRVLAARAFTGGTVARVYSYVYVSIPNAATVDFTLRIGLPQLEQNTTISTVIPTSSAAVTRAADALTLTPSDAGALTWRVRYDNDTEATLATGVTGAYVVDPAALARARVKAIWATP